MKMIKFLMIGVLFGIVLFKAQVVSWYRIIEMFRFEAFHMYGVIGTAVGFGLIVTQLVKRYHIKSVYGNEISYQDKNKSIVRYLVGGIIFGMGWAISGACPGPMFVMVGAGIYSFLVVIVAALIGTFSYGVIRHYLPH